MSQTPSLRTWVGHAATAGRAAVLADDDLLLVHGSDRPCSVVATVAVLLRGPPIALDAAHRARQQRNRNIKGQGPGLVNVLWAESKTTSF